MVQRSRKRSQGDAPDAMWTISLNGTPREVTAKRADAVKRCAVLQKQMDRAEQSTDPRWTELLRKNVYHVDRVTLIHDPKTLQERLRSQN